MTINPRPPFPPLFFEALCEQMLSDVLDAADVLEGMGVPRCASHLTGKASPVRLPREFLQGILIGVRLLRWERDGVTVHREAGLPSAEEHLVKVAQLFDGPELREYVTDLSERARMLFYEHFAWSGGEDLHGEIGIVAEDDDEFLDRLANFIWDHRHAISHDATQHEKTTE